MEQKYKAMLKSEIAQKAGVSLQVLRSWWLSDYEQLTALGFKINSKFLNPACVKFLCEKYVIILE